MQYPIFPEFQKKEDADIGSPTHMLFMGEDSDIAADWDEGVFTDSFRSVWGSINGYYVTMHVTSLTDEYVLYEVPLKIDGKSYNLGVAYDFEVAEYRMLSARLDESETGGIPSREERLLRKGDEITTLFVRINTETEEVVLYPNETFTLTDTPRFAELDLPDGRYYLMFLLTDYKEGLYYSDPAAVLIEDGGATISSIENDDAPCQSGRQ